MRQCYYSVLMFTCYMKISKTRGEQQEHAREMAEVRCPRSKYGVIPDKPILDPCSLGN